MGLAGAKYQGLQPHGYENKADEIFKKYNRWNSLDVDEPDGLPPPREIISDLESLQFLYRNLGASAVDQAFDEGYAAGYEDGKEDEDARS